MTNSGLSFPTGHDSEPFEEGAVVPSAPPMEHMDHFQGYEQVSFEAGKCPQPNIDKLHLYIVFEQLHHVSQVTVSSILQIITPYINILSIYHATFTYCYRTLIFTRQPIKLQLPLSYLWSQRFGTVCHPSHRNPFSLLRMLWKKLLLSELGIAGNTVLSCRHTIRYKNLYRSIYLNFLYWRRNISSAQLVKCGWRYP